MYFSRLTIPVDRNSGKRLNRSCFCCFCFHTIFSFRHQHCTRSSRLFSHFLLSLPASATCRLNQRARHQKSRCIHNFFPRHCPPPLTCCIVLVVVDELRDGVEVVLLCQVKLALRRGAYVIMSAASCRFPARRPVRLDSNRCRRQIFTCTETSSVGRVKCYLLS